MTILAFAAAPAPARASTANAFIFGLTGAGAAPQLIVNGGATVLSAVTTGWYENTGLRGTTLNYFAGQYEGMFYNDYFSFNLFGITAPITSAVLSIPNPPVSLQIPTGGFSGQSPALLTMWDVNTPYGTLTANQTNATGIYADLGGGIFFGSVLVGSFSNGTNVVVALNSDAIAAINLALGQVFSIGGSLVPAPGGGPPPAVPLPPTLPLMLVATGIPWLVRRARKKRGPPRPA